MKKTLRILNTAYYAIYLAAIIAAGIGFYILKSGFTIDPQSQTGITISSVLIIFIIGSVPVALGTFHKYCKKLSLSEHPELKIQKYQSASLLRLAVIGTALFLGVLFFYIMHSQSMIFCAGIAAIALYFCKPTQGKMLTDLNMDEFID